MTFSFCRFGLIVSLSVLLAANSSARAQNVTDPLAAMQGRWIWVGSIEKLGKEKACETPTRFEPSADRRELKYFYRTEKDGKFEEKSGSYNVLYQEGNSAAMYLNNETRRLKNGDRYIWIAIFESPDRFLWRVYGDASTPEQLAPYARVRCR
ncbi:MAG: hypothetical protein HY244_13780 [Rhizobiales bacterium]|nr:hypothetical protein [Hyphomicrobiales bacterium]